MIVYDMNGNKHSMLPDLNQLISGRKSELNQINEDIDLLYSAIQDAKQALDSLNRSNKSLETLEVEVKQVFQGDAAEMFIHKLFVLKQCNTNRIKQMNTLISDYSSQINMLEQRKKKSQRIINELADKIATIRLIELR